MNRPLIWTRTVALGAIEAHQLTNAARIFGSVLDKHGWRPPRQISEHQMAIDCGCGDWYESVDTQVNPDPTELLWRKWRLHADREALRTTLVSLGVGVKKDG